MAKRPDKQTSKRMNDLLRSARGFTLPEPDPDEEQKKRKARNARMNEALRAAARGFTDEDIAKGKVD